MRLTSRVWRNPSPWFVSFSLFLFSDSIFCVATIVQCKPWSVEIAFEFNRKDRFWFKRTRFLWFPRLLCSFAKDSKFNPFSKTIIPKSFHSQSKLEKELISWFAWEQFRARISAFIHPWIQQGKLNSLHNVFQFGSAIARIFVSSKEIFLRFLMGFWGRERWKLDFCDCDSAVDCKCWFWISRWINWFANYWHFIDGF